MHCEEDHPANYRGYMVPKELKQNKNKKSKLPQQQQRAVQSTIAWQTPKQNREHER